MDHIPAAEADEALKHVEDTRCCFATAELPEEQVRTIAAARMDPRHDYFNAFLNG